MPNSSVAGQRVERLFHGSSVFITGASGFIGRVLLEKLLRCYPNIERVYILLRPKRQLAPYERLHKHLLRAPIFDKLRAQPNGQQLFGKIVVLSGDIGELGLGLAPCDRKRLLDDETLSVVFHSAASVKFDEPLRESIKFNLFATKQMIELCKQLRHLKCLCHVSTAYVNSNLRDGQEIEERLYELRERPEQLLQMAELLNEDQLQLLKPGLVGARPNTYTYTKALAEHLIAHEAADLPVAIVRPSIVVAAWREPLPGWIDNLNGPTGLILAIGKGLLRTMRALRYLKADLIPVDIVVNTMVAAAHYTALTHSGFSEPIANGVEVPMRADPHQRQPQQTINDEIENNNKTTASTTTTTTTKQDKGKSFNIAKKVNEKVSQAVVHANGVGACESKAKATTNTKVPPIFHCTSGDVNPITWGEMERTFWPIIKKYPSQQVFRYPSGTFKQSHYHDFFMRLLVHYLPALIIDLICLCTGKKRQLFNIYQKLHRAVGALDNFCTTEYNFKTNNLKILQASLSDPIDKSQLYMDVGSMDWFQYWDSYILGARRYVLKEDDSSLEMAHKSFKRARYVEYSIRTALMLLAIACFYPLIEPVVHGLIDYSCERFATITVA